MLMAKKRKAAALPLASRNGVLVLTGIMVLAVWFGMRGPAQLIGFFLAAALASRAWSLVSLFRVRMIRSISPSRAFPGECITLEIIFENRKFIPVPWVEADDRLPSGLVMEGEDLLPGEDSSYGIVRSGAYLRWYGRVRYSHVIRCRKRGLYRLGPAVLRSGDVFGFYREEKELPEPDHVIVYPVVHDLGRLVFPSRRPLGEAGAPNPLFEDPSLIMGLRPYTPDSPFKYIHWKSSARGRGMQVKVFEPSASQKVLILLNADGFDGGEDDFEWAVSLTASLANRVIEQGHSAGCLVNSGIGEEYSAVRIAPGAGLDHLATILEALAGVDPSPGVSFENFFDSEKQVVSWGTTVCLVCYRLTEGQAARLEELRDNGFEVTVFVVGPELPSGFGLNCRRVLNPEDLAASPEQAVA